MFRSGFIKILAYIVMKKKPEWKKKKTLTDCSQNPPLIEKTKT